MGRTWTADYQGQRIVVSTRLQWRTLFTTVSVEVPGQPPVHRDVEPTQVVAWLFGTVQSSSGPGLLEVRIARVARGIRLGCHISVDGVLIGGDVHRKLGVPDPKTWESIRSGGRVRLYAAYGVAFAVFRYAVAVFGFGAASVAAIGDALWWALVGFITGHLVWRGGELHLAEYQQQLAAARRAQTEPAATAVR